MRPGAVAEIPSGFGFDSQMLCNYGGKAWQCTAGGSPRYPALDIRYWALPFMAAFAR